VIAQQLQGGNDIGADNIGMQQRLQTGPLLLDDRDPQGRLLEHELIVAAVADTDRRASPQLSHISSFFFRFIAVRQHGDGVGSIRKHLPDRAEGVGGEDMDSEPGGQLFQQRGNAGKQDTVTGQGAVVIEHQMLYLQFTEIRYGYLYHYLVVR